MSACLFLQAAVKALETAKDLGHKALEIKTDSKYTINGKDLLQYVLLAVFFMDIYHMSRVHYILVLSRDVQVQCSYRYKEVISWLNSKPSCFLWPSGSSKVNSLYLRKISAQLKVSFRQ